MRFGQVRARHGSGQLCCCGQSSGVSRALLTALEGRAIERGNARCILISTKTARQFYQANGYVEIGVPVGHFGTGSGYPMSKLLGPRPS